MAPRSASRPGPPALTPGDRPARVGLAMVSVAAHRIKQYGVEFYQASFSAREIDQLVKFEVLGYGTLPEDKSKKRVARTPVNWELLESRIGENSDAHPRPVIRRQLEERGASVRGRTGTANPL